MSKTKQQNISAYDLGKQHARKVLNNYDNFFSMSPTYRKKIINDNKPIKPKRWSKTVTGLIKGYTGVMTGAIS